MRLCRPHQYVRCSLPRAFPHRFATPCSVCQLTSPFPLSPLYPACAQVRTCLALLGFGLVLSRFFVNALGGPITSSLVSGVSILLSLLMLVFATYRYYSVVHHLSSETDESFKPDLIGPGIVTASTGFLILLGLLIVKGAKATLSRKPNAVDGGMVDVMGGDGLLPPPHSRRQRPPRANERMPLLSEMRLPAPAINSGHSSPHGSLGIGGPQSAIDPAVLMAAVHLVREMQQGPRTSAPLSPMAGRPFRGSVTGASPMLRHSSPLPHQSTPPRR